MFLCLALCRAEAQSVLFESTTNTNNHFRIPSIVRLNDGTLMAICDSRQSAGADVGSGWIDIICKTSTDDGKTWSSRKSVATHVENETGFYKAFGDACTVVDRESGDILLMAAAGEVSFLSSTTKNRVARIVYSSQTGAWSEPVEVSSELFKSDSDVSHFFFSSGRMIQSTKIKKGKYYRLYAGVNTRSSDVTVGSSRVVYSDDFGQTWNYLGGISAKPITWGDECKVEELPNGDIMLNAKLKSGENVNGSGVGRGFNIFRFTDIMNGTGSWYSEPVHSGQTDSDGETLSGGSDAELLLVPARRTSDNEQVYVLLLSSPMSTTREKVGIYYRELSASYTELSQYKSGWKKYSVTTQASGYSTMVLDSNGDVAFWYERDWNGSEGYDMVFQTISLSDITGGAYVYSAGTKGEYITTSDPAWGALVSVEAPAFSVNSGTYSSEFTVELTCATDGATIYYTTDGSTPTEQSEKYTGLITIGATTVLKAVAVDADGNKSRVVSASYSIVTTEDNNKHGTTISLDYNSSHQLFSNGAGNEVMAKQHFSFLRHDIAHVQMLSSSTRTLSTEGAGVFKKIDNNMLFVEADADGDDVNDGHYLTMYNGVDVNGTRQPYCFMAIVAPKGYRFMRYQMEVLPELSGAGVTIARYTYKADGTEELSGDSVTVASGMSPWDVTLVNGTNVLYFRFNCNTTASAVPVTLKTLKLTYVIDDPFPAQLPDANGGLDMHTGLLDLGTFSSNKTTHPKANGGDGYWSFDDARTITDERSVNIVNKAGEKQTEVVTVDGGQYFVAAANGDYYIEAPKKFRVVGATLNFLRGDAKGNTKVTISDYTPSTSSNGDVIVICTSSGVYLNNNNGTIEAGTSLENATRWTVTYVSSGRNNGYTITNGNYYLYMANDNNKATVKVRTRAAYWSYNSESGYGFSYNFNGTKYILYANVWGHTSSGGNSNALLKKVTVEDDGINYSAHDFTATVYNREDTDPAANGTNELTASGATATVQVTDFNNDAVHFNISGLESGTAALYNVSLMVLPLNPEVQTLKVAAKYGSGVVGANEVTSLNYIFNEGNDVNVLVPKDATSPFHIVFRNAENDEKTLWYSTGVNNNGTSRGGYSNYYLVGSEADIQGTADLTPFPDVRVNSDVVGTVKLPATNIADVFAGTAAELKDNEFVKADVQFKEVSLAGNESREVYVYSADVPTFRIMPEGTGLGTHVDYRYYTIKVRPVVENEKAVVAITKIYDETLKSAPHKTEGNTLVSDGGTLDGKHTYVGVTVTSEADNASQAYGVLTNEEIIAVIGDALKANGYFGFDEKDPYRGILYVDMSGLTTVTNKTGADGEDLWDTFHKATADNCLYFMPNGFQRKGGNTLRKTDSGFEALGDVVVYDQQPFFTPYGFVTGTYTAKYEREGTVETASGDRKATVKNMTAVLPFDISLNGAGNPKTAGDVVDATVTFSDITGYGEVTGAVGGTAATYAMLAESVADGVANANQPYYVTSTTPGFSFNILGAKFEPTGSVAVGKGVTFADLERTTEPASDYKGTWTAVGTYSGVQPLKAENLWYFASDCFWKSGALKQNNHVNIRPFRAYYTTDGNTGNAAKAGVVFDASALGSVTGISDVVAGNGALTVNAGNGTITVTAGSATTLRVCTVAGQLVAEGNLADGETRRLAVPQGVYLVNNVKVAVR